MYIYRFKETCNFKSTAHAVNRYYTKSYKLLRLVLLQHRYIPKRLRNVTLNYK